VIPYILSALVLVTSNTLSTLTPLILATHSAVHGIIPLQQTFNLVLLPPNPLIAFCTLFGVINGLSVSSNSLSRGVCLTTSVVFTLDAYVITPVMPMKRFGKWDSREEARLGVSV